MCGGMIEQHREPEWRWLLEDISRMEWYELSVGDKLMRLGGLAMVCKEKMMVSTKVRGYLYP
jgi:hypothetical protein